MLLGGHLRPTIHSIASDGRYAGCAWRDVGIVSPLAWLGVSVHDPATGKNLLTTDEDKAAARPAVEAENSALRVRIHELECSARASEPSQP